MWPGSRNSGSLLLPCTAVPRTPADPASQLPFFVTRNMARDAKAWTHIYRECEGAATDHTGCCPTKPAVAVREQMFSCMDEQLQ